MYRPDEAVEDILQRAQTTGVTDELLRDLHFFFGEDLADALNIVDYNLIEKVVAVPSGRYFYQVQSLELASKRKAPKLKSPEVTATQYYLCWSHYCSCKDFYDSVVKSPASIMCKHQVAVRIMDLLPGKCKVTNIEDRLYSQRVLDFLV
ncbi:hypothetical protein Pelo_6314 [Pelomyxa schiedti]|nr:hypothetical protein Pelo_6314 [Pelomyxa schiedti]